MTLIIPQNNLASAATSTAASSGFVLPLATEALYAAAREFWGNVKTYTPAEAVKIGPLGRRVFGNISFGEASSSNGLWSYLFRGQRVQVPILNVDCCLVDVTLAKEIVKTIPMGGSMKGSVKEHINQGDYQVSIKGILASTDGTYPITLVKVLHEFVKAPVQIPVAHELLYELGIYELVIENMNLVSRPGFENLQGFELQCVSDYPVELEIRNKSQI